MVSTRRGIEWHALRASVAVLVASFCVLSLGSAVWLRRPLPFLLPCPFRPLPVPTIQLLPHSLALTEPLAPPSSGVPRAVTHTDTLVLTGRATPMRRPAGKTAAAVPPYDLSSEHTLEGARPPAGGWPVAHTDK